MSTAHCLQILGELIEGEAQASEFLKTSPSDSKAQPEMKITELI